MSLQEKILQLETAAREAAKRLARLREASAHANEENRLLRERVAKMESAAAASARKAGAAPRGASADAAKTLEAMARRLDEALGEGEEESR